MSAIVTTVNGLDGGMPILCLTPALLLIVIAGCATISREAFYRRTQASRETQEEVRRLAGTAARERIARDLHDVVGAL